MIPEEVEAPGPTYVSGLITTNTTWTVDNSPYIVIGDVLVEDDINLTIEPGVIVKFDTDKYLRIDGTLYAVGNETHMILFTSNNSSPAPGDWGGIRINSSSIGSIIKYCKIEYGGGSDGGGLSNSANGLEISYSYFENNSASNYGGGVYNNAIDLKINYCHFENNSAFGGGGIFNNDLATAIINNSEILEGSASDIGGGICNMGSLTLNSFTISGNSATWSGGGIINWGGADMILNSGTITGNSATYGGGFYNKYSAIIDHTSITVNDASSTGGGIHNEGSATLTIIHSNISGNNASITGGGIHNEGVATLNINYSTITENSASSKGGGIYNYDSTDVTMKNTNIHNNTNYTFYNEATNDVIAPNNWWGTTERDQINQTIYDYYDDFSFGEVIFDPFLTSPVYEGGSGLQEGSPWPKFRGNVRNTGLSPYDTSGNPGTEKWNYTIGWPIERASPSVSSDGTVYIGAGDDKLYAFTPKGTYKWNFTTGDDIQSSAAIGLDGTIYFGSMDNNLYAIYPNGTKKWNYTTGWCVYSSPAIDSDGTIYVGSRDGKLYAIYPNGTKKWDFSTTMRIFSSPAIDSDGTIYIGSFDGSLYAVNPNGTQKWSYATGSNIWFSSPSIGLDGTIYIGSDDKKLHAVYPNGTQKWTFTANEMVRSSPAIGLDGTIYFGSDDYKVYAIYPNGTERWSLGTGGIVYSSPSIGFEGTIYVGSNYGRLYAIYPNGTIKWFFTTIDRVMSSPAIGSDGTIYVGEMQGTVWAIGIKEPPSPNHLPNNLTTPSGPTSGEINTYYSFSTITTDPDNDQINYGWDWDGDGIVDEWSGLKGSGFEEIRSHSWSTPGIYNISVKVIDEFGAESNWSSNFTVTITEPPPNQPPTILGSIPDQIKPEDNVPWTLDLTPYESDNEDSGSDLNWYLTGVNTSLYTVTGMNSSDDVFTFTPVANASGNDEVVLWLEDSEGEKASQVMWVNLTSVNDLPYFDPSPPDLFINYDTLYFFNYSSYVHDIETLNENLILTTSEPTEDFGDGYAEVNGFNVTFYYPQSKLGENISVIITLSDGEGNDNETIQISITEEPPDFDDDGIPDSIDEDDDNDGYNDTMDEFPLDDSEWIDSDSDGTGDNADLDDDNDGINDENDTFPYDLTEWIDSDSDGTGDNADLDDDNDGYIDTNDAFPYDSTEWVDTDFDGTGDNADPDDDNDGHNDAEDYYPKDPSRWSPPSNITVSSITLSNPSPSAGDEVTIYVDIQNSGNDATDVKVTFYDGEPLNGGTQIGSNQTIEVPSMGSVIASGNWVATTGSYSLYVVVEDLASGEDFSTYIQVTVSENTTSVLVLSVGDTNIFRFEPGQQRTISVEVTCYMQTVENVNLIVLDDQNLTVQSITPPRTMNDGDTIKFYLRITAPELPDGVEKLERDIVIQVVGDNGIYSNAEELDIVVSESAISFLNPWFIAGGVATGSLATLGLAAAASRRNENWKYLLLLTFAVPLYTRIHGKKTLDNFVRGQVFGHIQSQPGTHFNEIKKTLKVGNGNLSYHLRKLEKEGFIKSTRDKRFRRFYPIGVAVPEEDGIKLSKTQETILDFIEAHPKSGQKEIGEQLKESQQTVSYNLNVLVREGFLTEEKIKGTKRYTILDENT
jgi:outer membrane protein assembly factor BamB/DNA-binding MarR family transcriptional regulator